MAGDTHKAQAIVGNGSRFPEDSAVNYRHAFHAGNFADVVKHWVLGLCIARLRQKPAPLRVIDLFAGRGLYDLASEEARRSPEWQAGIGRLWQQIGSSRADGGVHPLADAMGDYLDAIARLNPDGALRFYPGSPALALALLRPRDRLTAIEAHPAEAEALRIALGSDSRLNALCQDGWNAGSKMVPPPEKRGLVLIDPPFEREGEDSRLRATACAIARKWPGGTQILWRPVKDRREEATLDAEWRQSGLRSIWRVTVQVARMGYGQGLKAAALYLIRPPFEVMARIGETLPALAEILAQAAGSASEIVELVPE